MLVKRGQESMLQQLPFAEKQLERMSDVNFLDASTECPMHIGAVNEETQRKDLIREYNDCISTSVTNLGKTDAHAMNIHCTTDEPIVYRPYRMFSKSEKRALRSIISEL